MLCNDNWLFFNAFSKLKFAGFDETIKFLVEIDANLLHDEMPETKNHLIS